MTAPAHQSSRLHTLSVGRSGPRIAFLHGLFGQGRNWTQIAKAVAGEDQDQARALLIDLPDHGRSPWTEEFSFEGYADAVAAELRAQSAEQGDDEPWTLVGHSLGGKTAMVLTLAHPELIAGLAVVDIAPKSYGNLHRFSGYIQAMRELPLAELTSRADADERFAEVEPDPGVRAFLLQNLRRDHGSWRWAANLELFADDAAKGSGSVIADFPVLVDGSGPSYDGPVVWLVGSESEYVRDEDAEPTAPMRVLFPRVRQVTVKGAGHWLHTDAPEVTVEVLRRLVAQSA